LCRKRKLPERTVRLVFACGIAANELVWWVFRYSHEGVRLTNLPLQLCDLTVWMTVLACFTKIPVIVEFTYFAGVLGSGMAVLTPDLWAPWPCYPAIYFFVAHGSVLVACCVLIFGKIAELREGAVWRAFSILVVYAVIIGAFDAIFGANYMYLRRKPANPSLLDWFDSWPWYLFGGAVVGWLLFWALWLPVRSAAQVPEVVIKNRGL
jgi:hypothetical integral membrane protein (TIGR02206 family)